VVDLVLEHAERRRHLSLGVITMGQSHERNIESELRRRLADRPSPSLDAFFAGDRMEPFFVKSLERSQGDERDAVIVSVGYHKAPDGRLPARFGPLLHDGGERRLNVAVTRARRSLVLVTSFEAADMDPARFTAPGVALLRQYLEFAAAPVVSERPDIQRPSSALVAQICTRLENAGVPTRAAYGMSGYTIDVAAAHPDDPERMVLAIELDGDIYRSAGTVRERDRLRPQMLESLGWAVHRIWSADWLADPRRETHRAVNAWVDAVMKADEKGRSVGAAGSS
jgi:very-short-patch-repair endonuclease